MEEPQSKRLSDYTPSHSIRVIFITWAVKASDLKFSYLFVYKTPIEIDLHTEGTSYWSGSAYWALQINFQIKLCHKGFLIPIHHQNHHTLSYLTLYNISCWFRIIKSINKYSYVHFQLRHQTMIDLFSVWFTKGEMLRRVLALPYVK
jgi:hypothetical protein